MPRDLVDLLWRDDPDAPRGGARGPRSRVTTGRVVDVAVWLADAEGLDAVTVRRIAAELGIAPMTVYTHVDSRDDLVVLMVDAVHATLPLDPWSTDDWRQRVTAVARAELDLHDAHPWLLDVVDQRTALGPGTIARYDHELHALDGLDMPDVERDAALTFVLDFVRGVARARRPDPHGAAMAAAWESWGPRLAAYLGRAHPLAQRVGAAAGAEMSAPVSAEHAWRFGLARVLDALAALRPR